MTALLRLPVESKHRDSDLSRERLALLNRLRFHAATCRASARLDLFEACSVLDPLATDTEANHTKILLRVMGQALDKSPQFLRPGANDLTFDEKWLLSLIDARLREDDDSFVFLLNRRIAKGKRRTFGVLVSGLAAILTKNV